MKRQLLDGNGAASVAMKLAKVQVVSAYPITPQSPISEKLASYVADGELDAKYIRVESEHSAMSVAIGAQLAGARAGTATSSVGLALMHEVLGVAAGIRVPVVMPVVNRALVAPWSLWCDHQDAMAERDTGWMQFYTENCQEVLDLTLIAFRVAEMDDVLTPTMVCLDGFFLSHTSEAVMVPEQSAVDAFLPAYVNSNLYLDVEDPMFINDLTSPAEFTEMRYQQQLGFDQALVNIPRVFGEFEKQFGRKYQMVDAYKCEDAEAVLITLGSMSGTGKYVVDKYRAEGKKVGLLKLTVFRPFPVAALLAALAHVPHIGVLDRSMSLGANSGPLAAELRACLATSGYTKQVRAFIAGLGGRDVRPETIGKAYDTLLSGEASSDLLWLDVQVNAMLMREVH